MAKTLIVPLLAFIYLTLDLVFGINLSDELKLKINDWVANGVALAVILYGIIKSHKKKPKK